MHKRELKTQASTKQAHDQIVKSEVEADRYNQLHWFMYIPRCQQGYRLQSPYLI